MNWPEGRRLIHFSTGYNGGPLHIGFVDYSGHRAKGSGNHFTAVHEVYLTKRELFEILKPHFVTTGGNEPDLVDCDGCGATHFSDEMQTDWEVDSFPSFCPQCANGQLPLNL